MNQHVLVIVEPLPEGSEVLVAIPFGKVCILQLLLCLNVEGAPYRVQMLKDLEWGDVTIRRVAMLELCVELFIKSIAQICCDALQESLPNVPTRADAFPLLFEALSLVSGGCNSDGWVVGHGLGLLDVCVNSSLMVVFVET